MGTSSEKLKISPTTTIAQYALLDHYYHSLTKNSKRDGSRFHRLIEKGLARRTVEGNSGQLGNLE